MTKAVQLPRDKDQLTGTTDYSKILPSDRNRALTVRDIMTTELVTAGPHWSLLDAARAMRDKHVSGLPVVDEKDRVVGMLSERDILRDLDRAIGVGSVRGFLDLLLEMKGQATTARLDQCLRRLERARVEDAMARKVVTIAPDDSMGEAARVLHQYSVNRLPVVEGDRIVGIVTHQNISEALR
jgi:CBS domain-containing protein